MFCYRCKGNPNPTYLPLEKVIVRTLNVLLIRRCLFNHLRARGIHVSCLWIINQNNTLNTHLNIKKIYIYNYNVLKYWNILL